MLIQGFTYYKKLESLISKLSKFYSVFVIEPIDEHYEVLFNEKELSNHGVVEFYLDYFEACMRPNVNVEMFIGHSFGGELAYRCAVRWHKKKGYMSKVCMLDTFANVADRAQEKPIPEIKEQKSDEVSAIEEIKEWNRHLRQMQVLKDDHGMPVYDGDVLYFKAKDLSLQLKTIRINEHEFEKKKQNDLNRWKSLAHHISIYPVMADHFTMLDERFCDDYVEKINDIVLLHNS